MTEEYYGDIGDIEEVGFEDGRPDLYGSYDGNGRNESEGSTGSRETIDGSSLGEYVWENPQPDTAQYPRPGYASAGSKHRQKRTISVGEQTDNGFGPESRHVSEGKSRKLRINTNPPGKNASTRIPRLPGKRPVGRPRNANTSGTSSKNLGIAKHGPTRTPSESPVEIIDELLIDLDTSIIDERKERRVSIVTKLPGSTNQNKIRLVAPEFNRAEFHGGVSGLKFNAAGDMVLTVIIPAMDRKEAMKLSDAMQMLLVFRVESKSAVFNRVDKIESNG